MNTVDSVPALLRIGVVFVLILIAIRRKVGLGNALTGGAVLLGLMFGLNPLQILVSAAKAMVHPKTLALSVIVMLILVLSRSMEAAGQMGRLLASFKGMVRHPSLNLIVFPALIGLLPMPGGAVFSAPMVQSLGAGRRLSTVQMSYVNYWFRHIWEYWWPLYPGVLLSVALGGLNLWQFVVFLSPLTVVAFLSGYLPLKGSLRTTESAESKETGNRPRLMPFLRELSPILVVIVVGLSLGSLFAAFLPAAQSGLSKESGLIMALVLATALVWHKNRFNRMRIAEIIFSRHLIAMFYMVVSILVFKGLLEDSRAVETVSRELIRWHIPLLPITIILPFLVGGIAGITIAFVGTTFPILISLVEATGQMQLLLPYLMLALVSGFVGVLLSPVHLCLQLSNAYFKAPPGPVYRCLWLPCGMLILAACLYFWISSQVLWR
jgi:integral membrane protein (TIGR00529 family)